MTEYKEPTWKSFLSSSRAFAIAMVSFHLAWVRYACACIANQYSTKAPSIDLLLFFLDFKTIPACHRLKRTPTEFSSKWLLLHLSLQIWIILWQTRLICQYNGIWAFSPVCIPESLISPTRNVGAKYSPKKPRHDLHQSFVFLCFLFPKTIYGIPLENPFSLTKRWLY